MTNPNGSFPMVVGAPKMKREDGKFVVSAPIATGDNHDMIWYRVSEGPIAQGVETFLAASLLPAMRTGGALRMPGPVSARLLGKTNTIQDILRAWCGDFQKIVVKAEVKEVPEELAKKGVGCFFSGGVDSFYSVLKHQDEITHLIYVQGFDIQLNNGSLRRVITRKLRGAACDLGKKLIEVETNLRELSDKYADWGKFYHGAALASVALLLSPRLHKVYIPATHTYAELFPWGSHVALDRLWSTEALDLVHDGCEASRLEKVAAIKRSDVAMRSLRVCYAKSVDRYNCGQCEKCLRTMVNLYVVGALEQCKTLNGELNLARIRRIKIGGENDRLFWLENIEAVRGIGKNSILERALLDALDGLYSRGIRSWPRRALNRLLKRL